MAAAPPCYSPSAPAARRLARLLIEARPTSASSLRALADACDVASQTRAAEYPEALPRAVALDLDGLFALARTLRETARVLEEPEGRSAPISTDPDIEVPPQLVGILADCRAEPVTEAPAADYADIPPGILPTAGGAMLSLAAAL